MQHYSFSDTIVAEQALARDIATALSRGHAALEAQRYASGEERHMSFVKESSRYHKTILSDLQGAWHLLRQLVVENAGFEGWERAIFHIDEAMSWEVVRNLKEMPPLILIIRNICIQGKANSEIIDSIDNLTEILNETFEEYVS